MGLTDKQLGLILRTVWLVGAFFVSGMIVTGTLVWQAATVIRGIQADVSSLTKDVYQDQWAGKEQAAWAADLAAANRDLEVPNPYKYISTQ